jgi:hypothetical protein
MSQLQLRFSIMKRDVPTLEICLQRPLTRHNKYIEHKHGENHNSVTYPQASKRILHQYKTRKNPKEIIYDTLACLMKYPNVDQY